MNHLYFESLRSVRSNPYKENIELQEIAAQYCSETGFPEPIKTPYVKVDEAVAKQIANWYEKTPDQSDDPEVRRCYGAMVREVKLQWDILIKEYGLKVEPFLDDFVPYKDSHEMMNDVDNNRHMWCYDGGEDHTLLTRRENFQFRAVHDAYTHVAHGLEFGPRGERNAYIQHCKMFSPIARVSLCCETNCQNSYVNFGPYSYLPVRERPFADQKALLVPQKWVQVPELQRAYAGYPDFFPPVTESNPRRSR